MAKPTAWLLCAAALSVSCVSVSYRGRADRAWAAGDLVEAARAYEALVERRPDGERAARALYRLALIHSLPDSPLRDPERAERRLERLVREHPSSRWAPRAALLLDLRRRVRSLEELSATMGAEARLLQREADQAVEELQREVGRAQGEAEAKQERIALLERQIRSLRVQLDRLGAEMARLEEELRRLKEIDLEAPP